MQVDFSFQEYLGFLAFLGVAKNGILADDIPSYLCGSLLALWFHYRAYQRETS